MNRRLMTTLAALLLAGCERHGADYGRMKCNALMAALARGGNTMYADGSWVPRRTSASDDGWECAYEPATIYDNAGR